MKTETKILVSVVASIAVSAVIALVAVGVLREQREEAQRVEGLTDITDKAQALRVLTASFREEWGRSDARQAKEVLRSMESLLKISTRVPREQILIEQLQRNGRELGPLIDQWFAASPGGSGFEGERREMLASQIWTKVQFISDDAGRLRDISERRVVTGQKRAAVIIALLIVVLAVTNGGIYVLTVRSVLRAQAEVRSLALFPEENPFPVLRAKEDGTLLYANGSAGAVLESWGCSLGERVPEFVRELMGRARESGTKQETEWCVAERRFSSVAMPIQEREYVNLYGTDVTEQKRAEEALRASERRFATLVEQAPVGIFETDSEGKCIFVNDSWKSLAGLSAEEAAGKGWVEAIHPEDRERVSAEWYAAAQGQREFTGEYRFRTPEGKVSWVMARAKPIRSGSGAVMGYLGTLLDVTERKRAERLGVLDDVFRVAPSFLHVLRGPEFIFEFANEAYYRLVGHRELIGRPAFEAMPEAAAGGYPERIARVLETGEPFFGRELPVTLARTPGAKPEERIIDLVYLPLKDADGTCTAVLGHGTDVTEHVRERRRAEEALRESEEHFRSITDTTPVIMWMTDANGVIEFVNRAYCEFFAVRLEQVTRPGGWQPLVHPEDAESYVGAYMEALRSRSEFRAETRVQRADGQWRWIQSYGSPRFDEKGEFLGMAGSSPDVTERKEFQSELERLVAERTAKLQELVGDLEHFSYTITHDLKSPLRAMRGFAEMMSMMTCASCDQGQAKDFLGRITTSAERMDRLIADALSYSRSVRQELPLEEVDAGALLRGMLDSYPELQPERASIRVEGRLPIVLANEAGLTQVFSNLLGNAVKFVKPGEKPHIRVWAEDGVKSGEWGFQSGGLQAKEVQSGPDRRGQERRMPSGWVRIWVEDKGIGIGKEMLPRVFDMFARGSKEYEGTGIGLALVRKVVQRMGGKVGLESEEGKGSRFWVEVPKAESRSAFGPPAGGAGDGMVLYVEDEESDARFMERAFEGKGLSGKLRVVRDGRAAMDYLSGAGRYCARQECPVPSVVLLDVNLPQIPGFQVLEWIRNNPDYARMPVVMFSSSTRENDRVRARELGADEFIAKPSSGLEFGRVVEGLLEKWLGGQKRSMK